MLTSYWYIGSLLVRGVPNGIKGLLLCIVLILRAILQVLTCFKYIIAPPQKKWFFYPKFGILKSLFNLFPAHVIVTKKGGEIMDGLNALQPLMQRSRLNKLYLTYCNCNLELRRHRKKLLNYCLVNFKYLHHSIFSRFRKRHLINSFDV